MRESGYFPQFATRAHVRNTHIVPYMQTSSRAYTGHKRIGAERANRAYRAQR